MTRSRRGVSVLVSIDGALKSTTYRAPLWVLRLAVGGAIALAVVLVAAIGFYGPIARAAARVPGLEREVERLSVDRDRVRELAQALDSVEANYGHLRQMVGADIVPDPVQLGSSAPVAPAVIVMPARLRPTYERGPSMPRHWPLDERGYMTRGQVADDASSGPASDEAHPGIDIAVPVGTLVRAAGGGTVLQTGEGAEYGRFVLLQHPDGYQTMYGHLSRITAVEGARIGAGAVLGRSGNTGRSSAPHLHFEIRKNGVSIDPLTLVKEGR
jgi:murein DD-endopeptidase MepM/ murein hydrolase activator NlpD